MKKIALMFVLAMCTSGAFADFQSPSGNIICGDIDGSMLICDVQKRDNKKPARPRPHDCAGNWGDRFVIEARGKAQMECAFDYPFDENVQTLPYGSTIKGKGWQCTSQKTGMTCKNSQGHGFTLSRKKQTLF